MLFMKAFFIVFSIGTILLCYKVGEYISRVLDLQGGLLYLFWGLHLVGALSSIIAPWVYHTYPTKNPGFWYNSLQWTGYFFMGLYSVTIFFVFLNDSSLAIFHNFVKVSSLEKAFINTFVAYSTLTFCLVSSGFGIFMARKTPEIVKVKVSVKNLPSEFEGFKILQMSDIHVGQTIKRDFISTLVKQTNSIRPDMLVLTGDLVDGTTHQLSDELMELKNLNLPYGKIMIPGNHEYYWGLEQWIQFWKEIGFTTLVNQHTLIHKKDQQILIAGVHDYSAHRVNPNYKSSPEASITGAPANIVKILLAHQPRSIYEAERVGFDLQLSGHTHSGQYFPYNLVVYLFQPFVKGLHRYKNSWIYVNQGTGYWGPPTRFGVPPEITLIELTKEAGV